MAESLLFEKAAGTQANYFGSYVEVSQGLFLTEIRGERGGKRCSLGRTIA